ncbi:hypothetical protein GOB83_13995 [Acetobacter fabarum]|jgi:hypothetical protein|nr:transposase [Acetobacter fabarum]MCP1229401.1 hypothetical protein [Acetobacter fabarum]MCP1234918.1 hypothetical protein [Acetobacter fabarum]NHO43263.1 hypothetical protein [Acetobacter fabarum]
MASPLVSNILWVVIEPLLSEISGEGPRVPDREALKGTLFVLLTDIR